MVSSRLVRLVDSTIWPFVYVAGRLLGRVRAVGMDRLPACRRALLAAGAFPIRNHYYEPRFDYRGHTENRECVQPLVGIDWNVAGQLAWLQKLTFADEFRQLLTSPEGDGHRLRLSNGAFESGDAECWYQTVRATKPRRLVEIGGGNSTLLSVAALENARREDSGYNCDHVCIEPYEMPWLEDLGIRVVRSRVEDVDLSLFSSLAAGDILFIDSSHVIRPGGDVLFEYLTILPSLQPGVLVHIHDIFSPKDYLRSWLETDIRFWNEQYLLEAFLSHNDRWEIVAALNFLHHSFPHELAAVAPYLTPEREPGSFYIRRVR